jgi:hypothetical protein
MAGFQNRRRSRGEYAVDAKCLCGHAKLAHATEEGQSTGKCLVGGCACTGYRPGSEGALLNLLADKLEALVPELREALEPETGCLRNMREGCGVCGLCLLAHGAQVVVSVLRERGAGLTT